jgi:pSer/pThr/pTyr-binding forkhead associated (FHA) protein
MPEIIVKFDNKVIERVVTEKEHINIGRTSDNDIVLDNRGVSRRHARLELNDDQVMVFDNESLNGTFVNSRKVTEEKLRDNDVITIGKFDLEFHNSVSEVETMSNHDGTMILNTRRQKELVKKDKEDKRIVRRTGCSVLLGLEKATEEEIVIDKDLITLGKSRYVNIQVKGWLVSSIQAKIVKEGKTFTLLNVGRQGKTKVNGESITTHDLRNGDIIQIGKTVFRFIEAGTA